MTKKEAIKLFEERKVRTVWDDELEKWYFSIVDVIGVLTDSVDSRKYWNKLKQRLKEEGNETVTNCHQLKLVAEDGKKRLTDVADTEQLFRLIQSVPSPKAEPFKSWMAQIASERIAELQDCQVVFLRLFKILYKLLFLLRLRNLIVRVHSCQRIDLSNRIDRHRPRQNPCHIIQIKRLYLDHPFQRIGTQGILHDLLTNFHIQITRQIVPYRCLNNDKGSKSDQQESKQGQHRKCGKL